MKRASISEAKNRLSALLDRVRGGQTVIIEDRGTPIARLEPLLDIPDRSGHLAQLERQGILRRPKGRLSPDFLKSRPPSLPKGHSAARALEADRSEGW
jgi:prevent-host-death family protein